MDNLTLELLRSAECLKQSIKLSCSLPSSRFDYSKTRRLCKVYSELCSILQLCQSTYLKQEQSRISSVLSFFSFDLLESAQADKRQIKLMDRGEDLPF